MTATNTRWFHHYMSMYRLLQGMHALIRADSELVAFAISWAPYGGAPDHELWTTFGLSRTPFLARITTVLTPAATEHPQLRELKHALGKALLRSSTTHHDRYSPPHLTLSPHRHMHPKTSIRRHVAAPWCAHPPPTAICPIIDVTAHRLPGSATRMRSGTLIGLGTAARQPQRSPLGHSYLHTR